MADLMKTSNPALGQNTFRDLSGFAGESMTISGTVNKAGILMLLCVASAAWTWNRFFATGDPSSVAPMLVVGGIGGFIHEDLAKIREPDAVGRHLGHVRAEVQGHRHPGSDADVRHAGGYVAGVPLGPD